MEKNKGKKTRYFDYSLLAIIIFLMCFGLIMLYSTTAYTASIENGNSMYYLIRQGGFCVAGFAGMLIVSKFDYHIFAKLSKPLYFVSFVLMGLVLTPLGKTVNGARRWLRLPFNQQLQPSELMKIAVILLISYLICKAGKHMKDRKVLMQLALWGGAGAFGVYFLTDNLSTAIIVLGIVCVLIFISHPKMAPFLVVGIGGILLVAVGSYILRENIEILENTGNFRLGRVLAWLQPEKYVSGESFQVMQGLYAIGSGGFFGKGLGNSAQKLQIPEAQNDMILAIVCEELGVFGFIVLLTMFGILLYRLLFIARNAPDVYGSLIVTGVFAHVAIQVILNVAVVLNVIPTTGITLPLISYGGTSTLFLMAEFGIALSVARRIQFDEPQET